MSASIHQEVVVPAQPAQVYAALTDGKSFSAFTGGAPAEIDNRAGGAFSLFGDRVTGRNIELVQDRLVVQAWRPESWRTGLYSLVTFALSAEDDGTRIVFDQHGHPSPEQDHLAAGWSRMYWEPLQAHFG